MKKPKLKPNHNRKRYHKRNRKNPPIAFLPALRNLYKDLYKDVAFLNLASAAFLYFDAIGAFDKIGKAQTDKLIEPENDTIQ